jgi:hypothetical protein
MKVKELIEQLKLMPQDSEVVMSKDGEGNNFSPFAEMTKCLYEPENTWSGELVDEEELDEEPSETCLRAVCLWPVS